MIKLETVVLMCNNVLSLDLLPIDILPIEIVKMKPCLAKIAKLSIREVNCQQVSYHSNECQTLCINCNLFITPTNR